MEKDQEAQFKMWSATVNVDYVMNGLGTKGYFHTSQFLLWCLTALVASGNLNLYIFSGLQTKHQCKNLTQEQLIHHNLSYSQEDIIYGECTISSDSYLDFNKTIPCVNGYHYTTRVDRSIVSKWDLICDKTGLAELTQTFYVVGQLISGICSPIFIEKFGRKPVHIASNIILLGINLVCAFSPYYWIFALMRLLNGIINDCSLVSCLTAVVELFPKENRLLMNGIFSFMWSLLNVVPGAAAYLLRDYSWTALAFFNCALSGFFIIEIMFLEESIRWLFVHGKMEQAKKVLKRATHQNKINFEHIWKNYVMDCCNDKNIDKNNECTESNSTSNRDVHIEDTVQHSNSDVDNKQQQQPSATTPEKKSGVWIQLSDIFKIPYLRKISIVIIIVWIVDAASYNGLYLLSEALGGSIYFNFTIMALAEASAALLYAGALTRFGHKISLGFSKLFGGVCLMVAAFIKLFGKANKINENAFVGLNLAAMFGVGAGYGGNYIYTPELYPTSMRSVGLGMASSSARVVVMGVPFLRLLEIEAI
ncbi:organic cation transporter protein-like [Octopus sinensis]|uniref:Organic cation transporter protein-like n=1 Tax=Octopus sinensis TaxID=2607531 RepID=A0A6P7SYH9_9MOLL|nr:organic cation transporter protein-like [Octopus sinensis]